MAPPASSTRRPNNASILAIFAITAIVGAWFMRIAPVLNDVPVGFANIAETGALPNGVRIKKHFTGVKLLDDVLSILVAAFIYGPTGWDEAFYWQQLHFLGQIPGLIAIMNVEACRERNRSSWLKYTAVYAFLYQNVGACTIVPIWWFLYHRLSANKAYFSQGRTVPLPYARLILPATIILYVLPTIVMFLPSSDTNNVQNRIAFWQVTPILVNIPLWVASPFVSSASTSKTPKARNADLPHLKVLYGVFFITSVAIHWYTIYGISVSENPKVTYASVWVPSTYKWKNDLSSGVLYLFQCDWVITGLVHMIPAFIAVCDVQRVINGSITGEQFIEAGMAALSLTWLAGPGAALTAVWYWRELKMALIEARASAGTVKKSL
ncbi:hypothetical protein T440DRAFT_273478 [Plenodomus tracheiphilus IPT5]|uniref:Uncharacterized protein n=1 Tax=Plenodomus tracheiphilus IPT5 TaxID=1408161 RepID=A0A6A7BIW3_9PLEO|nr:hypothetical protein T440DRAFT_273478 [Plenodomus tracheiphilus IPT5]